MGLNIKNERVHELARQAAAVTGKSQTGAIEEALKALLASYGVDPNARRLAARIDAVRPLIEAYVADPGHAKEIAAVEDLYDDATGLPR